MQTLKFLLFSSLFWSLINFSSATVSISISPSATNINISNSYGNHLLMYDLSTLDFSNPKALVHLPGTWGKSSNVQDFLSKGVSAGYLVLGMAYVNDKTLAGYCPQKGSNINCFWDSRRNIIQGVRYEYSVPKVNQYNSIIWRIYSLMIYIRDTCDACDDDVRRYIDNFITSEFPYQPPMYGSGIRWENLTISGHSQGAGHATVLGYLFNVSRIISLSGTVDWPLGDDYRWTKAYSDTKNTSANRFVGLVAHNEESSEDIVNNWYQTPYVGDVVAVPLPKIEESTDYSSTHQLCSTLPNNCFFAHGSTVKDSRLSDTWSYMLTADVSQDYHKQDTLCSIEPCSMLGELIAMLIMLILMGLIPTIVLYVEDYYVFKFPKGYRRRLYFTQLACFLVGLSLGFSISFVYVTKNRWPVVTDVFKIGVGVEIGILLIGSGILWLLKRYCLPKDISNQEEQNVMMAEESQNILSDIR